ncbi:o-succinylbenzoate synthase [Fructilactobacillus sp. Tb1]|uniref:o-succinylbenzoate synthase n=1 Tax=Fructilactobacillus sp. Tb1 TaxID=3422304 RepID=UPI003D2D1048
MKIKQIKLFPLNLKLKHPFVTNHGTTLNRPLTLVEIELSSGIKGYGEVQAFADDNYAPQTQTIALAELNLLLPHLIGLEFNQPTDLNFQLNQLTSFARASVEMALWDSYGKSKHRSLADLLGNHRNKVPVGIAIGKGSLTETKHAIDIAMQNGYRRLKLKVSVWETSKHLLNYIKKNFPTELVSMDANCAWSLNQDTIVNLQSLANHGLTLIEEPLQHGTLSQYTTLQKQLPNLQISLDETITDYNFIKKALVFNAADAFTLKQGKLGGISLVMQAINEIQSHNKLPWIGGMLASGLGRSVDLALAAQLGVNSFPADISASSRYFEQDIINEDLIVNDGMIDVPNKPGIGVTINWKNVHQLQNQPTIIYK